MTVRKPSYRPPVLLYFHWPSFSEHCDVAEEATPDSVQEFPAQENISSQKVATEASRQQQEKTAAVTTTQTAEKILALISEIGANQMLQDDRHFNPWFWEQESGRLMTV